MVRPDADPGNWEKFALGILPEVLASGGTPQAQASAVAADVHDRGLALSQLNDDERLRLSLPFFEETYFYDPVEASDLSRARVALAVRSSALESLHVDGWLSDEGIRDITGFAAAPLSHLTGAVKEGHFHPALSPAALNILTSWRSFPARFPRAWDAWGALATMVRTGSTRELMPRRHSEAPTLTVKEDIGHVNDEGVIVLDAMEEAFDAETAALLRSWAAQGAPVLVSSLSRFTRNIVKLGATLEWLLAHRCAVLTTNHLFRADAVFSRRQIIKVDPRGPLPNDLGGLSGVHRKVYRELLSQLRAAT